MKSALLSPAVKVSCLVTCNASSNDETGIIEGEICFADTDPANAPVLISSPHSSLALCLPCFWCCTNVSRTKYYYILKHKVLTNPNIAGVGGWVSVAGKRPPTQSSTEHLACSWSGENSLLGFCPHRSSMSRRTNLSPCFGLFTVVFHFVQ